ncbi:MAG TPA: energy transducer TonB [Bacteroidales bacterium]
MLRTNQTTYRIFIKIIFSFVSGLAFLTKGEKHLVNLKIALGTLLLSLNSNLIFSQQKDSTLKVISSENDSIRLDVSLEEQVVNLDDIVVTCYYGGARKKNITGSINQVKVSDLKIPPYIYKNMVYPKKALKNRIEGIVQVQYTVDSTCNIKNVKIIKGIGFGCDEEAVRVIKSLPKDFYSGYNIKNSRGH